MPVGRSVLLQGIFDKHAEKKSLLSRNIKGKGPLAMGNASELRRRFTMINRTDLEEGGDETV